MRQPPWLVHAWAELGQREIAGPRSNPRIVDYIRRSGHPSLADDSTAWCAAFVGACLERAGISGTGSLMARSYLDWGLATVEPEPGTIAVLSRGPDPRFGHVGFVVGLTEANVILLGGNQSDAVTVEAFPLGRLLALRRPSEQSNPRPLVSDTAAFEWSLARTLEFEGGYTDDPFDPGGPTNKGITLATLAAFKGEVLDRASRERLKAELRTLPDATVARIYRDRYWRPARCADLPAGLAHFHFDASVNQGVGGAARMLQAALGVTVDGAIGPLTLGAAARLPVAVTLARYAEVRRARYRSLQHFWRFGRGWLSRVETALAQAQRLAAADMSDPALQSQPQHTPPSKPLTETTTMPDTDSAMRSAGEAEAKWWGSSLTIWGTLVTAVSTVAPAILAAFGLDVPGALIERLGTDILTVAQAVGGLVGTVMTIIGRSRAVLPLVRRPLSLRV